jgi:hypothetical protein
MAKVGKVFKRLDVSPALHCEDGSNFLGVLPILFLACISLMNKTNNRHLLQSALQPLVGFRPAQLSLSILSRKVLQSAVASGTSNPQLGGDPGI